MLAWPLKEEVYISLVEKYSEQCFLVAAKNLILSGVRSVTIQDSSDVRIADLAAQFYLTEADLGRNRAEACVSKLQELNNAVHVTSFAAPINDSFLQKFQVHSPPAIIKKTQDLPEECNIILPGESVQRAENEVRMTYLLLVQSRFFSLGW